MNEHCFNSNCGDVVEWWKTIRPGVYVYACGLHKAAQGPRSRRGWKPLVYLECTADCVNRVAARTATAARAAAKAHGWSINARTTLCPEHVPAASQTGKVS